MCVSYHRPGRHNLRAGRGHQTVYTVQGPAFNFIFTVAVMAEMKPVHKPKDTLKAWFRVIEAHFYLCLASRYVERINFNCAYLSTVYTPAYGWNAPHSGSIRGGQTERQALIDMLLVSVFAFTFWQEVSAA